MAYSFSYFISPQMKGEFERFNLTQLGLYIVILQILGAIGLLVGLFFNPILVLSSGGLSLLMFFGLIVRIKSRDSLLVSFPALILMILNGYILYLGIAK